MMRSLGALVILALTAMAGTPVLAQSCGSIWACYDKKTIVCGGGAVKIYVSAAIRRAFVAGSYFRDRRGGAEIVARVSERQRSRSGGSFHVLSFADRDVQSAHSELALLIDSPSRPQIWGLASSQDRDILANASQLFPNCTVMPGRNL